MLIKVFKSIHDIEKEDWKQFISKRFFLSYKYLSCLESSCKDLEYRYTILYNDVNEIVGVAYFQIADFKGKSLFEYLPETNFIITKCLKFGLNRIDTKLLTLGNIIFTCENGNRFDESISNESKVKNLVKMIDETIITMNKKPLGVMVSEELTAINKEFYKKLGYHIFRVEDKMEMELKLNSTFDEYKNSLHSKYRVRLNRIYSLNQNTAIIDINVTNFELYKDKLQDLFLQVTSKSKFKLINIDVSYFKSFLDACPEKFKIMGFLENGVLIGFISYYLLEKIIEIHYIGIDYKYNESKKIYNYMLYKMIELGFEKKYIHICMSRTAQEIKSTLGATPVNVYAYLKINNSIFNKLAPFFLSKLVPKTWIQRHPFKN